MNIMEDKVKFTFDDVLAIQCCMEIVKEIREDKALYDKLLNLHSKLYDACHDTELESLIKNDED